jgi:hypothetical protein
MFPAVVAPPVVADRGQAFGTPKAVPKGRPRTVGEERRELVSHP